MIFTESVLFIEGDDGTMVETKRILYEEKELIDISIASDGNDNRGPNDDEDTLTVEEVAEDDKDSTNVADGLANDNAEQFDYLVDRIVGRKVENGVVKYRLRYIGFAPSQDTWEPRSNLNELLQPDADEWLGCKGEEKQEAQTHCLVSPTTSLVPFCHALFPST